MADSEIFDLVIVGAGISGIGMAAHYAMNLPGKHYVVLDRREQLGGTWDLFRYPGIRSDSDMYTFSYRFEPWQEDETVAPAAKIRNYLRHVVEKYDIAPNMRFSQHVETANWDSAAGLWRIASTQADGSTARVSGRFLFMGTGYYDYDNPFDARIPKLEAFKGTVIHPQFWPENFDYAGKRVVIIGSGATAVTVVPAMAQSAAHVTMLQRTPTWYGVRPSQDKLSNRLRRILPARWAHALNRERAQWLHEFLFRRARNKPEGVANFLTNMVKAELGDKYNAADFTPPYNPWDQRLCLVPDGDMFQAIRDGRASITTGNIAEIAADGVVLADGRKIDADVIVTATGLNLATLGKVKVSVDGAAVEPAAHFWYRNCMFSNVPNFAVLFGYLNAGWTLRVDIVADWLCRLLVQMDAWKVDVATPVLPEDHGLESWQPFDLFSSGYLQRGKHLIPKSATSAPWRIHMYYRQDKAEMKLAPIDDGWMSFERLARNEDREITRSA